ncbi:uncharacterized protein MCYG_02495 [Microsporum canis CBS 113480]|uniref:Uncharacterized protein n=1 Tax=Arthroderma otae (strain ATCC MYA-4605 / CBS 113480) TaxID=554155 RepID=C5FFZ1_ARTOC|nr:uncharacterized protein MCYG_02495 [Microsporum canis CBS 113480]EEQ29676.1 predicted protein [Microsporum canis CBS 113480]
MRIAGPFTRRVLPSKRRARLIGQDKGPWGYVVVLLEISVLYDRTEIDKRPANWQGDNVQTYDAAQSSARERVCFLPIRSRRLMAFQGCAVVPSIPCTKSLFNISVLSLVLWQLAMYGLFSADLL